LLAISTLKWEITTFHQFILQVMYLTFILFSASFYQYVLEPDVSFFGNNSISPGPMARFTEIPESPLLTLTLPTSVMMCKTVTAGKQTVLFFHIHNSFKKHW